jgi:hypothetical protein
MATSKKKTTKKAAPKKTEVNIATPVVLPPGWVEYDGQTFSSKRKVESYKRRQAVARGEA